MVTWHSAHKESTSSRIERRGLFFCSRQKSHGPRRLRARAGAPDLPALARGHLQQPRTDLPPRAPHSASARPLHPSNAGRAGWGARGPHSWLFSHHDLSACWDPLGAPHSPWPPGAPRTCCWRWRGPRRHPTSRPASRRPRRPPKAPPHTTPPKRWKARRAELHVTQPLPELLPLPGPHRAATRRTGRPRSAARSSTTSRHRRVCRPRCTRCSPSRTPAFP